MALLRARVGACTVLGVMLAASAARADDRARADALFRDGRAAANAGDWAGACAKFAASQRLDASTGTLLNLGDCEEHLRHLVAARNYYQTALGQLGGSDPRVAPARERLRALEARLPRITITLAPDASGASIVRDGAPLPPEGLGVASPVDPGEHVVVVAMGGHKERRETVRVAEGESVTLVAHAGEPEGAPRAGASSAPSAAGASGASGARADAPTERGEPARGAAQRTWGWIAIGVGAAGLATAAVSGVVLLGDRSTVHDPTHCPTPTTCDAVGASAASSGRTWLGVNTASWIVAVVGASAGAVLLLTSPSSGPAASASVAPVPGGAVSSFRVTF